MNIHTPERQEYESQAAYRARQVASNDAVRRMTKVGGKESSREQLRNAQRKNGALKGVYGAGLMAAFARKAHAALLGRKAKSAHATPPAPTAQPAPAPGLVL